MASMPFWVRPWGLSPWAAQTRSSSRRSSCVIQQDSNTLPSRLEEHRLAGTVQISRLSAMYTRARLSLALAAVLAIAPLAAAEDCRSLRERRDQLASQAMQAEIALLHDLRQHLCPQQETAATQINAQVPLDFGIYIRCRARAEAQLQQSRPVLHRNRLGFPFYTADGAHWAQQADAMQASIDRICSPSPTGSTPPAATP